MSFNFENKKGVFKVIFMMKRAKIWILRKTTTCTVNYINFPLMIYSLSKSVKKWLRHSKVKTAAICHWFAWDGRHTHFIVKLLVDLQISCKTRAFVVLYWYIWLQWWGWHRSEIDLFSLVGGRQRRWQHLSNSVDLGFKPKQQMRISDNSGVHLSAKKWGFLLPLWKPSPMFYIALQSHRNTADVHRDHQSRTTRHVWITWIRGWHRGLGAHTIWGTCLRVYNSSICLNLQQYAPASSRQ